MGEDDPVPQIKKAAAQPPPASTATPKSDQAGDETGDDSGSGGGLTGWLRGAFMSKKDKGKVGKLGKKNEAYYDKNLKRWIFPGDTGEAAAAPPSAPPTSVGGGTNPAPAGQPSQSGAGDNIAALMAPPARRSVSSRYATFGNYAAQPAAPVPAGNGGMPPGMMRPGIPNGPGGTKPKIMSFPPK